MPASPNILSPGGRHGLPLLYLQAKSSGPFCHFQALDGAFTEENRAQCRAATAPLLEAVDNLSAFASNPEFSSIPAQISPEVRQCEERTEGPNISPHLLGYYETNLSASLSLGPGCHGAHCDLCQDNVGECWRTNPDSPGPRSQSSGPPTLVSAGRPLPNRLRFHQEAYYKHEVLRGGELVWLGDKHGRMEGVGTWVQLDGVVLSDTCYSKFGGFMEEIGYPCLKGLFLVWNL